MDECPEDPNKVVRGQCGCARAETDDDGDGLANCVDICPAVAGPGVAPRANGCSDALATWLFEDDVVDASGNGGAFVGPGVEGNRALSLPGRGTNYVSVGAFDVRGSVQGFSVAAWVKPQETGANMAILSNREAAGPTTGFAIFLNDEGRLSVRMNDGGPGELTVGTLETLPTQEWTHVAVSFDYSKANGDFRTGMLYVNGKPSQNPFNQGMSTTRALRIGGMVDGNWAFYGELDKVQILPWVVSDDDVARMVQERSLPN